MIIDLKSRRESLVPLPAPISPFAFFLRTVSDSSRSWPFTALEQKVSSFADLTKEGLNSTRKKNLQDSDQKRLLTPTAYKVRILRAKEGGGRKGLLAIRLLRVCTCIAIEFGQESFTIPCNDSPFFLWHHPWTKLFQMDHNLLQYPQNLLKCSSHYNETCLQSSQLSRKSLRSLFLKVTCLKLQCSNL